MHFGFQKGEIQIFFEENESKIRYNENHAVPLWFGLDLKWTSNYEIPTLKYWDSIEALFHYAVSQMTEVRSYG